ncbi:MAG: TasA family protein [Candidatus Merdivicinus sp.]|jgi:predicted ribosomally synthesized peptide with SipW-like signal peptide
MKNLKKVIVAASLCAAIGATAVAGTLAYFTDESETKTNVFTVGDLDITLNEVWNAEDGVNIVPGRDIVKTPDVTLTGVDGYLRVDVDITAKNSEQQDALNALLANNSIKIDYNTNAWEKVGDYYYYKTVMTAGTTEDLFTKVEIADELDDELEGISGGFDIVLKAYGVQEEGFEASKYEGNVLNAAKAAFAATFDKE